jgi:hypothetical protein
VRSLTDDRDDLVGNDSVIFALFDAGCSSSDASYHHRMETRRTNFGTLVRG